MPWRRAERALADYNADIARGESVFDAALNTFGKNLPLVSAGWGLGEAIEGRVKGGVDHGRQLNWGDRGGRIANFVAAEAAGAAGAAARSNVSASFRSGHGGLRIRGPSRSMTVRVRSGNVNLNYYNAKGNYRLDSHPVPSGSKLHFHTPWRDPH